MVLNRALLTGAALVLFALTALASSGASAQQYRADEFLNLDLSRAVLSPKPLGPAASFAPGPLDVTMDRGKEATAPASAELVVDPKTVPAATVHAEKAATSKAATSAARVARARVERAAPHKSHTLVALHGRNPMEAQARDTSVQVWPCRSGGICNWKR
ncbi:MAG TPA: hypothetical protein VFL62_01565 [Bradyrhizobium sp.]|uniref:hypothetical protein n=1 Tax=Bradyrhizobium sp. TaxID=376 RepID=UPI002D8054F1|nr:hypothetical protein [Bradyrhizobium sp.]HET7884890.1 hypothetical protein [Bradyrhizobium sp.]